MDEVVRPGAASAKTDTHLASHRADSHFICLRSHSRIQRIHFLTACNHGGNMTSRTRRSVFIALALMIMILAGFDSSVSARHRRRCGFNTCGPCPVACPAPCPVACPAPCPVISCPAPAPVISCPAPCPVVSCPAPAPVISCPAPAPVISCPAPAPVISCPSCPAPAPVVWRPSC